MNYGLVWNLPEQRAGGRPVPVLILPIGGAFSRRFDHSVWEALHSRLDEVGLRDIRLTDQNTLMHSLPGRPQGLIQGTAALAETGFASVADAARVRRAIFDQLGGLPPEPSQRGLLLVGKSIGGVTLWNTLRLHYAQIAEWFHRIALVLVDPHGAAIGDGRVGSYGRRKQLRWQPEWSNDQSRFRVYNLFQREDGLLGASFPKAYLNTQLHEIQPTIDRRGDLEERGIEHMNIAEHWDVREAIRHAYDFVRTSG